MPQPLFDALARLRWARQQAPEAAHPVEEARFVEVVRPLVDRWVRRKAMGRPHQLLEELTQDITLAALRSAHGCKATNAASARGWVLRIANNTFNQLLRELYREIPAQTLSAVSDASSTLAQRDTCDRLSRRTDDLLAAAALGAATVARTKVPDDLLAEGAEALTRKEQDLRKKLEMMLVFYLDSVPRGELARRHGIKPELVSTWLKRARRIASVGLRARHRGHPPVDDTELSDLIAALVDGAILEQGCR